MWWRLGAQSPLEAWDEKISFFESAGKTDSLGWYYQLKARHYRAADSLAEWAYCYWDWQSALYDTPADALALLDTVVQTAWRAPKNPEEKEAMLWVHSSRGHHLVRLGKILESISAFELALEIYQDLPPSAFDALEYLFLPLGANYTRIGDNEKARLLYQTAIAKFGEGPQSPALAGVYNNLGLTYWNEGKNKAAIEVFEQGLDCRDLPLRKESLLLLSISQSQWESGRIQEARQGVERSIRLLKTDPTPDEETTDYLSGAYLLLGRILSAENQYQAAQDKLQTALDLAVQTWGSGPNRDVAKIWMAIGALHLQTRQAPAAIEAYNQAISRVLPGFKPEGFASLPNAGQLYPENSIYEALEGKAEGLQLLYEQHRDTQLLSIALQCHQLAGQVEGALRRLYLFESSKLTLLSQHRRRTEKAIRIARQLYEASNNPKYLYAAWADAEQAKSILLLESVQRHLFSQQLGPNDTLINKVQDLKKKLAYFECQLLLSPDSELQMEWRQQQQALLLQMDDAEQILASKYPSWATDQYFSGDSILKFRQSMPNYAIIEYFTGKNEVEVFCQLPSGQVHWASLPHADSIAAQTQLLISLLQSRTALQSAEQYRQLAASLFKQIAQPVFRHFDPSVEQLLIIPDGWMAFLPFEALLENESPWTSWSKAPFLLYRYPIHYNYSLAVTSAQKQLPDKAKRLLLQVAPGFAQQQRGLAPLLQSDKETPRGRQLKGAEASVSNLLQEAPQFKIVHLSTHAGVDSAGLLPRVELYDRPAYLPDIYALNLHADLVVLSACQTGLGHIQQGEGVMSLARAFSYAGAKGLVSSLWTINESTTAHLFRFFYRHLKAGASKPLALHQAKLDYLSDPAVPSFQKSPYYWAGLIYLGEEGSITWSSDFSIPWFWLFLGLLSIGGVVFMKMRRGLKRRSS